jgi:SAM-dependent methyltransferase
MMLEWPVEARFMSSPEVTFREQYASFLKNLSGEEIVRHYTRYTVEQMDELLVKTKGYLPKNILKGIGIELGAGCGVVSSLVAREDIVEKVYAVEIVKGMTKDNIPKVANAILRENHHKVIPVFGSFNEICIDDNNVDFVIEFGSLHHSGDLKKSFSEIARVLKSGGYAVLWDRCHADTLADEEIECRLNEEYTREFLERNFYPLDYRLTRRENGEHEYRLREWREAFGCAGLHEVKIGTFYKKVPKNKAARALLRNLFRRDNDDFNFIIYLKQRLKFAPGSKRVVTPLSDSFYKPTTLMLLQKK